MSRFANPDATYRVQLGACQCAVPPVHENGDWIDLRSELGAAEIAALLRGSTLDFLEAVAVKWNLLDDTGQEAPVDREHLELLFGDTFDVLNDWVTEHIKTRNVPLPNASGGRSRRGTRASASPVRTTPINGSSTTPSLPLTEASASQNSSAPNPSS